MRHVHWLVTESGADRVEYNDDDVCVTYAGYFPGSRGEAPLTASAVRYGGLALTDYSECPSCP